MSKKIAIPYYGGKNYHVNWLVPLLPYGNAYIEPFGGSMAVLLNRARSPVEVYNDLDGSIVNLFRVLRENGDELIKQLELTPYARGELAECQEVGNDPVEWARRVFVRARQSIMGLKDGRSWACSLEVRKGTSQMISRWLGGIDSLYAVIERIKYVLLECRPALEVISRFDSPDSVFYLDPPYPREARKCFNDYLHEMSNEDHIALLDLACSLEGKVAISSYRNKLYDSRLSDWWMYEDKEKELAGARGMRQEILWTNYDPAEVRTKHQTGLMEFVNNE